MTNEERSLILEDLLGLANGQEYRLPLSRPMVRYIVFGNPVGDFLHAVVSNDLAGAACRADTLNQNKLQT